MPRRPNSADRRNVTLTQPLYQQVAKQLAERILAGGFPGDGQLPYERHLCIQCNVSRTTIRGALQVLEAQKLIHRIRGKGTFVSHNYVGPRWFSTATTILFAQVQGAVAGFDGPGTFYGRIRAGVQQMVRTLGLAVKDERVRGYVRVPFEEYTPPTPDEVGGVILSGTFDKQYIQMYQSEGVPVVVVDYWVEDMLVDCIAVDVEAEANIAVQYLADRGHTSIGFLAAARGEKETEHRTFDPDILRLLECLRRAAKRQRLEMRDEWIALARSNLAVEPVIRPILGSRARPTAMMCFDAPVTRALLDILRATKIRCPDDISIIGRGSPLVDGRTVTSFSVAPEILGQHAVRLLAERMQGHRDGTAKVAVASRFVRGTTVGIAGP